MDDLEKKTLRYIDTGKVKIGIHYIPHKQPEIFRDMEQIQQSLLPKTLGTMNQINWPTPLKIIRWFVS